MAEGSELMDRLLSENADLKRQVRLLKENQMLKRLLCESCPDGSHGARDALLAKAPIYTEGCSPGTAGEACSCVWSPRSLPQFPQAPGDHSAVCPHARPPPP